VCSSPIESRHSHRRDVDSIAGLLYLSERQPFTICASQRALDVLPIGWICGMLAGYHHGGGAAYFAPRLTQAPQDVDIAPAYVKAHARTRAEQEAVQPRCVLSATYFGHNWALYLANVEPGMIPLFVPD
jgi:hypothetical protein